MAESIYIACGLTSFVCAVLLIRGYLRSRSRLLLWSSACFVLLTLNNLLLFMDKIVFASGPDLGVYRSATAFTALSLLVYGLIWNAE